jgi:hypothetical protein
LHPDFQVPHEPVRIRMRVIFRYILIFTWLVLPFAGAAGHPQDAGAGQKKIDREKQKRQKEAQKDYNKALKEHHQRQSKETKSMMRQSRKDSKKNTPLKKK